MMRFAKANTWAEQPLAGRFGIRSTPDLTMFRQGRGAARQAGAMQAWQLRQWLQPYLD